MSTKKLQSHPDKLDEAESGDQSRKYNHTSKNDIFGKGSVLIFHDKVAPPFGGRYGYAGKARADSLSS